MRSASLQDWSQRSSFFGLRRQKSPFENLTEDEQAEEIQHLKNGMNFAKKVVVTEECDVLVLDEVLGLMDYGIVTAEDLRSLIGMSREGMRLIFYRFQKR